MQRLTPCGSVWGLQARALFLGLWLKALAAGLELGAEAVQWGMG